jgi:hypothetical protein
MIEKQSINGKEVWLEVEPYHVKRDNPNIIPTEYFVARYYLQEPISQSGNLLRGEDGNPRLFESPVAALNYASTELRGIV